MGSVEYREHEMCAPISADVRKSSYRHDACGGVGSDDLRRRSGEGEFECGHDVVLVGVRRCARALSQRHLLAHRCRPNAADAPGQRRRLLGEAARPSRLGIRRGTEQRRLDRRDNVPQQRVPPNNVPHQRDGTLTDS